MYLSIIILPLLGSIVSGFFGRKIGVTGSRILSCLSIITTTILAIFSFFEVGFNNNPIYINLFKWLDCESFNMVWNFQFDSLTVFFVNLKIEAVLAGIQLYKLIFMQNLKVFNATFKERLPFNSSYIINRQSGGLVCGVGIFTSEYKTIFKRNYTTNKYTDLNKIVLSTLDSNFLQWFVGFTDAAFLKNKLSKRNISTKRVNNNCLCLWGTNLGSTTGEKFLRKELAMVKLLFYQKSVIVGLILSDGWLIFGSGKTSTNARLGLKQFRDRSSYVWFVFNQLSHYCNSSPRLTTGTRAGKTYYGLEFFTRSMPCITELYHLFYHERTKIIPSNIYELLTPVALAHLIMGDGGFKSQGIYICTDSYTVSDVIRLMNVLILRYDLKCTLHKASNKLGYRIYISRNSIK